MCEIHVLFRLPPEHAAVSSHLLAYVEWFTPLGSVYNADVGMFSLSRSTHNHQRRLSIIPISQVERTCHLIPVFGAEIDKSWTREKISRLSTRFFVNPYFRHSDFVILRLLVDRWIEYTQSNS